MLFLLMLAILNKIRTFFSSAMDFLPDAALIVLIPAVLALVFFAGRLTGMLTERNALHKQLKEGRKDAVKRSRAVIGGQMAEQIAPFLPDFPCNPADVRFIGKPVDFIAFPGMAEGKSIEEIVLVEVKTGTSQLSEREKEIKSAAEKGNVRYVEYRI